MVSTWRNVTYSTVGILFLFVIYSRRESSFTKTLEVLEVFRDTSWICIRLMKFRMTSTVIQIPMKSVHWGRRPCPFLLSLRKLSQLDPRGCYFMGYAQRNGFE